MRQLINTLKAIALTFPLCAFAADAPPADTSQKATLEFVRSSGALSVVNARIEINGKRVAELGKGETNSVSIDPGRTLVKVDSAYSPGQMLVSFTTEKGAEYRFEVFDGVDKLDVPHAFGTPPKAANAEVLESGGVLKMTLVNVKLPKQPEPAPVTAAVPVKAPDPATPPAITPLTAEEQLKTLKRLFDQKLITKEVYAERQRKIIESIK